MAADKKANAAEIAEDAAFQRVQRRVQRVGWAVMTLAIIAALCGLFGVGPLSNAKERVDATSVEYGWLLRNQAPATYRIDYEDAAEEMQLRVGAHLLRSVNISRITPQPLSSELTDSDLFPVFGAEESGTGSVIIEYRPNKVGVLEAEFAAGASRPLKVYP